MFKYYRLMPRIWPIWRSLQLQWLLLQKGPKRRWLGQRKSVRRPVCSISFFHADCASISRSIYRAINNGFIYRRFFKKFRFLRNISAIITWAARATSDQFLIRTFIYYAFSLTFTSIVFYLKVFQMDNFWNW